MSDTKYEVELWKSDDAEEMHLFMLKGDQRGAAYVLGYNPKLFAGEEIRDFLARHGYRSGAAALHLRDVERCFPGEARKTRGEEVMRAIIAARQAALERGQEPDHVLVPAGDERALADAIETDVGFGHPGRPLFGRIPDELRLFGMRVILARTSEVIAWRAAR